MATKVSTQVPGEGRQNMARANGEDPVTRFLNLIRPFCEGESGQNLMATIQTNEKLKEEVEELRTTQRTNLKCMADQENDLKSERESHEKELKTEIARAKKALRDEQAAIGKLTLEQGKVDALCTDIRDGQQQIKGLLDAIKKVEADAVTLGAKNDSLRGEVQEMTKENKELEDKLHQKSKQLETNVSNLKDAKKSLVAVRSFLVPLQVLDPAKRSAIRDCFEDLFRAAMDLFQSALYHDLSDEILMGGSLKTFAPPLPLPPTNSPAAKQMRVVAGLTVCGRALAHHLFRDSFLTKDHELDKKLHLLATTDQLHHAYIREVLAKVLPSKQKQCQDEGVELVIDEIMNTVGQWCPTDKSLRSGLKTICDKATSCWALAHQVKDRVWLDFDLELLEDWHPLPLPASESPSPAPTVNVPRRKSPPVANGAESRGPNDEPRALLPGDIAKVVWPTLLAAEPQTPDSTAAAVTDCLHCGYVLTQAQIQDAEDEIRAARRTRRTDLAPQKKRRDSGAFLSGGALGSSSVK